MSVPCRSKRLQGEVALPSGYYDEENCTPSLSCRRKDETGRLGWHDEYAYRRFMAYGLSYACLIEMIRTRRPMGTAAHSHL